jgi:hypothetical protein
MEMKWAASLYDKAKAAKIPYFWKQISAYRPEQGIDALGLYLAKRDGIEVDPDTVNLIRDFPTTKPPIMTLNIEKGKRSSEKQLVSIGRRITS